MIDIGTYKSRRAALKESMRSESGLVVFIGNVDAPAQYKDNCYKWRQDSTWLYLYGIDEPRLAATLDLDSGEEVLYGDDYTLDDIIWTGPMPSVAELAQRTGIASTAPYSKLDWSVTQAIIQGRRIHTIPASRYYVAGKLDRLGIDSPSEPLIKAIIRQRLVKSADEIALLDAAADLGVEMHTVARRGIMPGRIEQTIVGAMEGVTLAKGWGTSFPTILTQHGEIFHCHSHECELTEGKLLLIDAGAEAGSHYASDFTRTYPTSGKFSPKQRDIYEIVWQCNEYAFSLTKPEVQYRDVHIAVATKMLECLGSLGLVSGDPAELASEGIAGLFMPHGLGHNMGLDVHDMEDLGEDLVGYDDDQKRSSQLGLRSLRMARRLTPGNVVTDEPGIYFIPALIESWKKEGKGKGAVNYSKLEDYYDFGGIRLEDDVLVTPDGARRLGHSRLPIAPDDIENILKQENGL